MDKREMIGRALGELLIEQHQHELIDQSGVIEALAEQAIVIECEVGHEHYELGGGWTSLGIGSIEDHHGTPGKALAIILPLKKMKKNNDKEK